MDDNKPPEIPSEGDESINQENQEKPRGEVQKIHGVLRARSNYRENSPEPATPEEFQPNETIGGQTVFCSRCGRPNSPRDSKCRWCGMPIDAPPVRDREPSKTLGSAYWNAMFHASAEGLSSEVPGASWGRVWIGLLIITLISALSGYLVTLFYSNFLPTPTGIFTVPTPLPNSNSGFATATVGPIIVQTFPLNPTAASPIWFALSLVWDVVGFFLNSAFVYWLCRRFSGVGRTGIFRQDYMVHCYLISLMSVPISLASGLLLFVPFAGGCITLLLAIYGIRLQYFAIRASMQLTRSNARNVIIVEFIVLVVIFFLIFCGTFAIQVSSLGQTLLPSLQIFGTPTPFR